MKPSTFDDYLEHYGVLGMKWGVRKDRKKAYSRAIDEFEKKAKKANEQRDRLIISERKRIMDAKSKGISNIQADEKAFKKAYKYFNKAKKYAQSMTPIFEKYSASEFDPADIARGQKIANDLIYNFQQGNLVAEILKAMHA